MKRVAIFISCDSFEGFYGGTFGLDREEFLQSYRNDFVWEYAEGLRKHGHEVLIYILSRERSEFRWVSPGLGVRFLSTSKWLRSVDPILFRSRRIRYAAYLRDIVSYKSYGQGLERALQDDCVDVLYHQEIWTPRFDIVVRRVNLPVIGADHGAVYAEWMRRSKRRSMKQARYIICQSRLGLERALGLGGNAVLMQNAVDIGFFVEPTVSTVRPKTILAVGRLVEEQKCFSDLLRALSLLPDFSLILVGSGPDEAMLKKQAEELGLGARARFAGFVRDRTTLRGMYQQCGVFVSTSRWEAMALVLLEAMSCAAPVVATRIPSFEELITDGEDGFLIPVGAPDQVAEAIRTAYEQQHRVGSNARKTIVNHYSSTSLYQRLSSLVEAA